MVIRSSLIKRDENPPFGNVLNISMVFLELHDEVMQTNSFPPVFDRGLLGYCLFLKINIL